MLKIAVFDAFFSWPPHGGACVDVFDLCTTARKFGYDIRLFLLHNETLFKRGQVASPLEIPFEQIEVALDEFMPSRLERKVVPPVVAWKPDIVFIANSHFLKPHLVRFFASRFPTIVRFYTYECFCYQKDGTFFRDGQICPHISTESKYQGFQCLKCGIKHMLFEKNARKIFLHEFLASGAYRVFRYQKILDSAMKQASGILVYNSFFADRLAYLGKRVTVIPSGTDLRFFPPQAPKPANSGKKIILMSGRTSYRIKGLPVLFDALKILRGKGEEFELRLTLKPEEKTLLMPDPWWSEIFNTPWIRVEQWRPREKMAELYREADICVFPSSWVEPCGIVAIEAMACRRPVVVSSYGGLSDIVRGGKDGLTFAPLDPESLAMALLRFLHDSAFRDEMAGKALERSKFYEWDSLFQQYYQPLFSEFAARS